MTASEKTAWITRRAAEIGFDLCGVVLPENWPELDRIPDWLACGYAGEMGYLNNPRRQFPASVFSGAKSIILCALNYNTAQPLSTEAAAMNDADRSPHGGTRGWISRYAWGDDYHRVLGEKLNTLVNGMRGQFDEAFQARAYVDTGPLSERVAARHAGLGWLAKNTCLINEHAGSWLFLGAILTTLDCAPSVASEECLPADLCGNCTLCIDACPTAAITEPYVLDARRCISYLTIELRGTIPEELRRSMGNMIFGCDICQDVCPWNHRAGFSVTADFLPREIPAATLNAGGGKFEEPATLFAPSLEWMASLTEEEFEPIFRGSPVRRTKWRGLIRNACVALGNSRLKRDSPVYARITALLTRLSVSEDETISEHARWALCQLQSPEQR